MHGCTGCRPLCGGQEIEAAGFLRIAFGRCRMIHSRAAGWNRISRLQWRRIGTMTLLLLLVATGPGAADETPSPMIQAVRVGLAAHDVDGLWSHCSRENGPDVGIQVTFNRPFFHVLGTTLFPDLGASINTRGDTSKVYGGALMTWMLKWDLFFTTGLGLALHNGKTDTNAPDRKSLGFPVLFRIPLEAGYVIDGHHRIIFAFDHISNAYLASENEGMDTLGLFYEYHF